MDIYGKMLKLVVNVLLVLAIRMNIMIGMFKHVKNVILIVKNVIYNLLSAQVVLMMNI